MPNEFEELQRKVEELANEVSELRAFEGNALRAIDELVQNKVEANDLPVIISESLSNLVEVVRLKSGQIESDNFEDNVAGWQVLPNGDSQFSGSVQAGTFRTALSGERVEMNGDDNNLVIYDSSDVLRMRLEFNQLTFFNSAGAGRFAINTNTADQVSMTGDKDILLSAVEGLTLGGDVVAISTLGGGSVQVTPQTSFQVHSGTDIGGDLEPLTLSGEYNLGDDGFGWKALYIGDGITAPSTPTGEAVIYVDTSDGDLKVKFSDGHVAVIASDS